MLKSFIASFALVLICFSNNSTLYAKNNDEKQTKLYTINFDNVPIHEFIRFIGKISTINFIFNENELNFNITIVSEEKTSLDNIMSALVQILRIHGLSITEDGENLFIHQANALKQIPAVVSQLYPKDKAVSRFPIITRIFSIKNGSPKSIADLLTPMLSSNATIEVSKETRQIIVTDTQASINNVERFISSIDDAKLAFETTNYTAKNIDVKQLELMVKNLIVPFQQDTPLIMVAKPEINTIYICSTPFLNSKAIDILKEIDTKEQSESQYFIYNIKHANEEQIRSSLKTLASYLKSENYPNKKLITSLESMKWIKSTNSLAFIANEQCINELKALIPTFDIDPEHSRQPLNQTTLSSDFFVYRPINVEGDHLQKSIKEVAKNFLLSNLEDPSLIQALESVKWLEDSGVLIFTSSKNNLTKVQKIVVDLDKQESIGIYHSINYPVKDLSSELQKITNNTYSPIAEAIKTIEINVNNNTIVIYGSSQTIKEIKDLLTQLDKLTSISTIKQKSIVVYSGKNLQAQTLLKNLKRFVTGDSSILSDAVNNIKIDEKTNSLIITAPPSIGEEIKKLLSEIDQKEQESISTVVIYKCKNMDAQHLISIIKTSTASQTGPIANAVHALTFNESTNTISIFGSPTTIKKIDSLLTTLDQPLKTGETVIYHPQFVSAPELKVMLVSIASKSSSSLNASINKIGVNAHNNTLVIYGNKETVTQITDLLKQMDHKIDNLATFVYKPIHITATQLQEQLKTLASHLDNQDPAESSSPIAKAINNSHVLPSANTIQFVISEKEEPQLKDLIKHIDIVSDHKDNFLVWNLNASSPTDLIEHLKEITKPSKDKEVIQAVDTARFVKTSHSIVFSGKPKTLAKIKVMLEKLDPKIVAKKKDATTVNAQGQHADYSMYTPVNVSGGRLIQLVQEFEQHLISSGIHNTDISKTIDHLSYLPQANEIIVAGTDTSMQKVLALLKKFDHHKDTIDNGKFSGSKNISTIDNIGFLVYKLRYQQGKDIVAALSSISTELQTSSNSKTEKQNTALINAVKSIKWIEPTNSLIGSGDPQVLTKVSQLIKSIDRPLEQIFIEVLILQTNITDQLTFGLQWGTAGKFENRLGWNTGVYPASGGSGQPQIASGIQSLNSTNGPDPSNSAQFPGATGGALEIMGDLITHSGRTYASLGSLINSLKSIGEGAIVLSQKVVTQDNQTTKIFDGQNIPFTGSLVTTTGLSQTTNANLEYRNIGTTLAITPTVGDEGVVNLDINLSISETPTDSSSSGGQSPSIKDVNGIQTTMTTIQTKTQIKDKTFLMLGGSYRNNTTRSKYGVPCLGGLPIVGGAFSTTQKLVAKTGIIMFIRPQIIQNNNEYISISERQEQLFLKQQSATQEMKEAFDLMLHENKHDDKHSDSECPDDIDEEDDDEDDDDDDDS